VISDEQILSLLGERRTSRGPRLEKMRRISEAYSNEIVLPLPEMDSSEEPAVANILSIAVDSMGQRVASVLPKITFAALGDVRTARAKARTRRDVVYGWWDENRMDLQLPKRGRQFFTYASTVVHVRPSARKQAPIYELRDPLTSYPSGEDIVCDDCLFTYRLSLNALERRFGNGQSTGWLAGKLQLGPDTHSSTPIDVVEYVDAEETVLLAVAQPNIMPGMNPTNYQMTYCRLNRAENRLSQCPVVAAGRPGLQFSTGQFDGMVGIYTQQAMLQALEVIAVKRDIFPDTYLVGADGANPRVVKQADGLRGIMGTVSGGDIRVLKEPASYQASPLIDRLERNSRVTGRVPAEFGGESPSGVRTGRRGDAVMSAVVDFPLQEAQRFFAHGMRVENEIAIEIDKEWYNRPKKVWVSWQGVDREVDYSPEELWTTDRHTVSWSHPGSDTNGIGIAIGSAIGMGIMSKKSGMDMHPMVQDGEQEHDQIQIEMLEQATLQGILAQAQSGSIPPGDMARIMQLIAKDMDLAEAIITAQTEAQERQAQQVAPTDPAAQPGLAPPGMGAEAMPSIAQAPEGQRNLSGLMAALRMPTMQVPAESGAA
jgi:hypothetical protein